MKHYFFIFLLFKILISFAQDNRIDNIKEQLNTLSNETLGLNQKVNINIKQTTLSDFLIAVSEVHKININVSPKFEEIQIVNNFTDVSVKDLLVFLCKEYSLNIDFTGNILSIKSFQKPEEKPFIKEIDVKYKIEGNLLSLDLKQDKLYDVLKRITDVSGKNLVFAPNVESKILTSYIKDVPFDDAMDKLAFSNQLTITKTKDNFYLFENIDSENPQETNQNTINNNNPRPNKPFKSRKSNFYFKIIDYDKKIIEVDFENTPISSIVHDISNELSLNVFYSSPLEGAGNATVKSNKIKFEDLLTKIFEAKSNSSPNVSQNQNEISNQANRPLDSYSFNIKDNMYFFGLKSQLVLRNIKQIPLMHRSIEILNDPDRGSGGRTAGRVNNPNTFNNFGNASTSNNGINNQRNNLDSNSNSENSARAGESILSIFPNEILNNLEVKIDVELNSFLVNGPAENIIKFEDFVKYIDKPIPVILIEVMLLEVNRNSLIETGISAGIGDKPTTTSGTIYPNANINLGAQTINKIINSFDGFGSLNLGSVMPNFNLSLKALESNGSVNIKSTPRLSTLNGHRAYLSIGETTYYVVTNQNFYGSQIPQTSEIKNFQPIDAELSLTIRPLISGDGQITMDIKVIQSSFNGQKIDKDAPPGINSREFTSIIRVKDQEIIVLGGLEEKIKNDTGSGIPFLARIPVLKWLFSSRKREDSKKKLSVLIKPTVIY
jgi:type IV pilus assembly protein PilQ